MLKTNKSITLTGTSEIEGVQVIYLSANLGSNGGSNATVTKSITNQVVYDANKVACRADISEFTNAVYEIEDEIMAEGGTV